MEIPEAKDERAVDGFHVGVGNPLSDDGRTAVVLSVDGRVTVETFRRLDSWRDECRVQPDRAAEIVRTASQALRCFRRDSRGIAAQDCEPSYRFDLLRGDKPVLTLRCLEREAEADPALHCVLCSLRAIVKAVQRDEHML